MEGTHFLKSKSCKYTNKRTLLHFPYLLLGIFLDFFFWTPPPILCLLYGPNIFSAYSSSSDESLGILSHAGVKVLPHLLIIITFQFLTRSYQFNYRQICDNGILLFFLGRKLKFKLFSRSNIVKGWNQ